MPRHRPREGQLPRPGALLQLLGARPSGCCLSSASTQGGSQASTVAGLDAETGGYLPPPRLGGHCVRRRVCHDGWICQRRRAALLCPAHPSVFAAPSSFNAAAAASVAKCGFGGQRRGSPNPLLVVPRSAEIQAAEAMLESALVVLVGGTRPFVSPAMVYQYLHTTFDITHNDVDVRRHHPEDFVVRFRSRVDRDRVLSARPRGALLPLIWRPWRRTSMASAASFYFRVLVALANVPLHARSVMTAQVVLGTCCASIELTALRDILEDDDREFFVTAWCWDPSFIVGEQPIFIPEPHLHS